MRNRPNKEMVESFQKKEAIYRNQALKKRETQQGFTSYYYLTILSVRIYPYREREKRRAQ